MLSYCLKVALSLISSPRFRNTVSVCVRCIVCVYHCNLLLLLLLLQALEVLVRMYRELDTPDYISICQVRCFTDGNGSFDVFLSSPPVLHLP